MIFDHESSHNLISKVTFDRNFEISDKIVAVFLHLWSGSEPGVDTVGIYVEIITIGTENSSFGYNLTI